jgi:CHRD domain
VPARGDRVGDDHVGQRHAGATATQQLAAKDLAAVITAIRAAAAYANVHTSVSPGGEIRGQIRAIAK